MRTNILKYFPLSLVLLVSLSSPKLAFATEDLRCVIEPEPYTVSQVERDYQKFKQEPYPAILEKAQGTPYAKVGPAVTFASVYKPNGLTEKALARLKYDIIYKGYGVGGVSQKRRATPVERATLLTLLKDTVAPFYAPKEEPKTEHEKYIGKAIAAFTKPDQNQQEQTLRSWADDLACVVKPVGYDGNPYLQEEAIEGCIDTLNTLYRKIITPPSALDTAKLEEAVTQHLKILTLIEDRLWKWGSIDTLRILNTKKWRAFYALAEPLIKGIESNSVRCLIISRFCNVAPENRNYFVDHVTNLMGGISQFERLNIIEALVSKVGHNKWKKLFEDNIMLIGKIKEVHWRHLFTEKFTLVDAEKWEEFLPLALQTIDEVVDVVQLYKKIEPLTEAFIPKNLEESIAKGTEKGPETCILQDAGAASVKAIPEQ